MRARHSALCTPQLGNVNLNLGEASRSDRFAKGTAPNPTTDRWYDAGAFSPVPAGSFAFGNSGRNILDGPGAIAIDDARLMQFGLRYSF